MSDAKKELMKWYLLGRRTPVLPTANTRRDFWCVCVCVDDSFIDRETLPGKNASMSVGERHCQSL